VVRALVYHEKGTQFDSRPLTLGVSAKEMMIMGEVLLTIVNCHTVTKPYAGFRHPDQMASDQTVRGGEHFVPPQWHFSFLHAGRHFPNFLEIYPVVKRKKRV
jgi:hypothetical protein